MMRVNTDNIVADLWAIGNSFLVFIFIYDLNLIFLHYFGTPDVKTRFSKQGVGSEGSGLKPG